MNKTKRNIFIATILPCLGLLFQAQVFANTEESILSTVSTHQIKKLNITISELHDSAGLVYVGAVVSKADLASYLSQLSMVLGDDFSTYRKNQSMRDHNSFHVTLINPYEYKELEPNKVKFGQQISVTLQGIGIAKEKNKTSYFVVTSSAQGQEYRQQHSLKHKDLHVTLGFDPQDVYSVRKDVTSLLNLK